MSNFSEMVKLEAHLRNAGVKDSEDWAFKVVCYATEMAGGEEDIDMEIMNDFLKVKNQEELYQTADDWGM